MKTISQMNLGAVTNYKWIEQKRTQTICKSNNLNFGYATSDLNADCSRS